MDKIILLLVCLLPLSSVNASDYIKNLTMTKGGTITLDLQSEIGFTNDYPSRHYISNQNGGTDHDNETYFVSDALALYVNPIALVIGIDWGTPINYYTYQITAKETGNYTFYQEFRMRDQNWNAIKTITYYITVVDVTAISMVGTHTMFVGADYQLPKIRNYHSIHD